MKYNINTNEKWIRFTSEGHAISELMRAIDKLEERILILEQGKSISEQPVIEQQVDNTFEKELLKELQSPKPNFIWKKKK